MYYEGVFEGKYVNFKSVTLEDAQFTRDIRRDPAFTKFLPKLENTLAEQKSWILSQQKKEDDYFFVVWNKKAERIGTAGIFDIKNNSAEVGRLAMRGNAFQNVETGLLMLNFAFDYLHLESVVGYVYPDNHRAIRFNQKFGANYIKAQNKKGQEMLKAVFTKENTAKYTEKICSMLYR